MRVVNKHAPEQYVQCPKCKSMLAFTKYDIKRELQPAFRFFRYEPAYHYEEYIECCKCGEYIHLGYDDIIRAKLS